MTTANAPKGVFQINDRKVIVVAAGTSLIKVANDRDIKLRNLVHYNDLENDESITQRHVHLLTEERQVG